MMNKINMEQETATYFEKIPIGDFFSIRRVEQSLDLGLDTKNDWTIKTIYNYYIKVDARSAFNFYTLKLENITNRQEVFPQSVNINITNEMNSEYQLY